MKKFMSFLFVLCLFLLSSGFTFFEEDEVLAFELSDLYHTQKKLECEEIDCCSSSAVKTYMDYRAITLTTSIQYQYIQEHCIVDKTGFLLDEDHFIGVALGSYFGDIGERYYFTLDTGIVLPVVKIEAKADVDTDVMGCEHNIDGSVIEFVIDSDKAEDTFGRYGNGLILQGNYSNYPLFSGEIVKIERVLEDQSFEKVTYRNMDYSKTSDNPFRIGSGY